MQKLPISIVVITYNEEHNIQRCLQSAEWADDKIVVDSNSQDRTREIAQNLSARVFNEEWRGYGPQKQRAVELAKYDWVLCLDADEALSPELSEEIQNLAQSEMKKNGYRFPRLTRHLGKWIRHGGWYPDKQLRLFNRKLCQWSDGSVHEQVQGENIGELRGDLLHFSFEDVADQVNTNNHYSSLMAAELYKKGRMFTWGHQVFKPVSKFFETFVLKFGFLDGWPGLVISVSAAYSVFLKFAKLRELEQKQEVPR